ncbi:MAG: diaminopimelate epimerase [Acidiferrobacterales bacterium]
MRIPFTKMHGAGNDFVVFDAINHPLELSRAQIRAIARRRFGIGCDQVLILEPTQDREMDFTLRIYNADGGEVEHCGNGIRCMARFVRDRGLARQDQIAIATLAGPVYPRIEADGTVTANMGIPEFDPVSVPFEANTRQLVYDLDIEGKRVSVSVLSLGNPHAVQLVEELDDATVEVQGPLIENHRRFPRRVNAGFMQVVDRRHIRVRVHERGVGETLACGTGATAAVVAGRQRGLLEEAVDVALPGGVLRVVWKGEGEPVYLTGPAVTTYEGSVDVERL